MQLNAYDDFPFHQGFGPLHVPATSDSHYQDGYYFAFYRPGQHIFCGLRLHPNTNVMDGYAGLVTAGEQRNVRLSRALLPDHGTLAVGPLQVEVIEPMRRQRLRLAENPTGLTFDVETTHSMPPFLETGEAQYRYGRLHNDVCRYTLAVRATGWMELDGDRTSVDSWHGCRDHSWGIRSTMGPYVPIGGHPIPDVERDPRAFRLWIPFEIGDLAGFVHTHETAAGRTLDLEGRVHGGVYGAAGRPVVGLEHELRYHEGTKRLSGGTVRLTDDAGEELELAFDVACAPAHPQGFGYTRGWSDGGQPGVYRGLDVAESDRFRADDPTASLGPAHVPAERRLGGTEFVSTMTMRGPAGEGTGMAHVEHMLYG
ncbi:hypothetical protein [Euzebya tangerina]|uniref:hypothetical protein n=1 Tax=Euzebya tangerina TaxID=591198 RepID=UPI000E30EE83|nr:hypothetical protein [Euzebya tangerina]